MSRLSQTITAAESWTTLWLRRPSRAKGVRDEALAAGGRYLYALDADAQRVFGWAVGRTGGLTPVGSFDGLPATVAGFAVS